MFAVMCGVNYEGETLKGIYSTVEAAKKVANKEFANTDYCYDWATVYAVNVDDAFDDLKNEKVYSISKKKGK